MTGTPLILYVWIHIFAHSRDRIQLQPTSTRCAAVARLTPTYSLRKQNIGLSVSSNLTTPGSVSPCTLA